MSIKMQDSELELLTVSELANRLQVKTSWIYGHADELGVFRLGKYLRFSWGRVLNGLTEESDCCRIQSHVGVPSQRPSPTPLEHRV